MPVTWCAEHLTTLWLLLDEHLTDQVARRELAPLTQFPDRTRRRLGETLLSWLQNGGNSEKIAVDLSVHPQTVRYRVRQLKQAFGDASRGPGRAVRDADRAAGVGAAHPRAANSAAFSGSRTAATISAGGTFLSRPSTTKRPSCPVAPVTTIIVRYSSLLRQHLPCRVY